MKVFVDPHPQHAPYGIRRVVDAMRLHLPSFGVEVVDSPAEADVINNHALTRTELPGKPMIYSSHGLYWNELTWPDEYHRANQYMIDTMVRAQAITAPSQWVANAISRGILHKPTVAYHGVDTDEWTPGKTGNYVLWNKARADVVSDPADMQRLASLMPGVTFVSTIGSKATNVHIVGVQPYDKMRPLVQQAGVYLATARETMGIGTLEALSCGVPVAGWNHGGQREIVIPGETGYLAPYGDYDALKECVRLCFVERERLSANARQDAIDRWQWPDKIAVYAAVFKSVLDEWQTPRPKVSVIITAHNLAKYLPFALESVKQQTLTDWECLIVDDASTDNTADIGESWEQMDGRFKYLPTPRNLKLSGARNYGFNQANGRYIIPLDADDMLSPNALKTLSAALDSDPGLHIAYGHLDLISEDGSGQRREGWPFDAFDWYGLMGHINQLPYCSMMRREVLERGGGYRVRDWRAEDASMWARVTSLGFRAAKVTQESLLLYRLRPDSKGAVERQHHSDVDGDWTAWYPWRIGATTAREGEKMLLLGKKPRAAVVPFGAQGKPFKGHSWPVWSHHDPMISVVIPCGPRHGHLVVDAVDSVLAQTFPFWEVIVANDTGNSIRGLPPFVREVEGGRGIAASRNAGIDAARAPLILFLDADDILVPTTLEDMLRHWIDQGGSKYVYVDWFNVLGNGKVEQKQCAEYDRKQIKVTHPINVLMKREHALAVGGFDTGIKGWEDWDFFTKLKISGYCGSWLAKPLMVYRTHTGERREQSLRDKDELFAHMNARYGVYFTGEREMKMCCGNDDSAVLEAKRKLGMIEPRDTGVREMSNGLIRLEYIGQSVGATSYRSINGKELSRIYRLGNNPLHKYVDAPLDDAAVLIAAGICKSAKSDPGIDLSQAAVPQFEIPAFVPQVTPPEPEQPARRELKDPGAMNLAQLRSYLIGLGTESLRELREMEAAGQNRKGALSSIDLMLEETERMTKTLETA